MSDHTGKLFDYESFKSRLDTQENLTNILNIFNALNVNAENEDLCILTQRVNARPQVADPEFDFELNFLTMQEAEELCNARQARLYDHIDSRCGRSFFNRTMDNNNRNMVEVSRPEASEFSKERDQLLFLDAEKKIVNWTDSLPRLKIMAHDRRYSTSMMKECLLKLADVYNADTRPLIQGMTANQIAVFLLKLDTKKDKISYYRTQLYALIRKPSEELQTPLTTAQALIDKIHPVANVENASARSAAIRIAIISFVSDEIAVPILLDINPLSAIAPYTSAKRNFFQQLFKNTSCAKIFTDNSQCTIFSYACTLRTIPVKV